MKPYESDNHEILVRDGSVDLSVVSLKDGELRMRFVFKTEFKARDSNELWGIVEGEASTLIRMPGITASAFNSSDGAELDERLRRLLEGAYADEILLPVSQVVRAMRLPSLLVPPVTFDKVVIGRRLPKKVGESKQTLSERKSERVSGGRKPAATSKSS